MKKIIIPALTSLILLFFPKINFGQAPTLGVTSSFAIFTSSGAIVNTGTTNVWGDIGSNSTGSSTGSSITLVVGSTHFLDATSSTAAVDVATAYSYLSGLSCDSTISTPFGNGLVLVPGRRYCLAAASTLNGDLILDAKGNSSAIFNFKIGGALTTNTSSRIILKNGASFCNIYWLIGGAANLGTISIFRGTILADGAINFLDYDTLEGRGLTKAGAITLINNKVIGCDASGQPLPIKLIQFYAKSVGQNAQLFWSTASETNNDFFTIERSKDGIAFTKLLSVKGAGNSSESLHYSAMDYNPYEGTSFYRLSQTDYDGRISYSCLVSFHFVNDINFKLYPNPVNNSFTIRIDNVFMLNNCKLSIVNTVGKVIINKSITKAQTTFATDNLPTGIYFYRVYQNGLAMQSGKMMVKH